MKKTLLTIAVCFLIIGMPVMTAFPTSKQNLILTPLKTKTLAVLNNDTPPDWAAGNFSGVWGLNFLGIPLAPAGWIEGYFANTPGLGRLEGKFAKHNVSNATNVLAGFMLWIFFMGGVSNTETGDGTYVTGIGVTNETHFYWRLNAIIRPSYYIQCEYSKFEE